MSIFQVIIVCAWCPPDARPVIKEEDLVSHGICEDCLDQEITKMEEDGSDDEADG